MEIIKDISGLEIAEENLYLSLECCCLALTKEFSKQSALEFSALAKEFLEKSGRGTKD